MFCGCFKGYFVKFIIVFLYLEGAACFFVKHLKTGKCIKDTANEIFKGSDWGSLSDIELVTNCLDPASQFRFRENGAMLNLERQGCLTASYKWRTGGHFDMFFIYVDAVSLDRYACAQKPSLDIHRVITQTSGGALSQYNKGGRLRTYVARCAEPKTDTKLAKQGLHPYIAATTSCDDSPNKIFNFGVVTCYGKRIENANCPKNQTMVVKTASYRGFANSKKCGLSDDHTCEVDVTCFVMKHCDGQHECTINVNDSSIPVDACSRFSKYLYFEYRCVDTPTPFRDVCVHNIFLSNSLPPNQGVLQITTHMETKNVCWKSLRNNHKAKNIVCRQLGYQEKNNFIKSLKPADAKHAIFSGRIQCSGDETTLSQCSIKNVRRHCALVSYIQCNICARPHLENKERIPDSSFTASASSQGHNASHARISSGSSWCAPVSDDKPYLQLNLNTLYQVNSVATFGDSTSAKWVTSYNLNYSLDLTNWKQALSVNKKIFEGNENAYNHVARRVLSDSIKARALRFIPITFVVQACMRIEICGFNLLPDEPTTLKFNKVKSRSAKLSWLKPKNEGKVSVSRFWIKLKKDNVVIQNITTRNANVEYEIKNLAPFTAYEISIAAGNLYGFGKEIVASLKTSEEAPSGAPMNIKTTSRSTSTLTLTWDAPEERAQNGAIVSYTVCVSHSNNASCFATLITSETNGVVANLQPATKYYVRVLASNNAGSSIYSLNEGFFTNERAVEKATRETSTTLTFSLEIPSKIFLYFFVVVLKVTEGKNPTKFPDSYRNDELVTHAEMTASSNPKPYIAAILTASGAKKKKFVLGDRSNTTNRTTRRRRSPSNHYHNGPLQPGTSYRIFQRIFINDQGEYYSTEWSPASKTEEYSGGPRVLTNMSSGAVKVKEGDSVTLMCSAQGEPPLTFSWEKDMKLLKISTETDESYHNSFLILLLKDDESFGKYICHIRDRFQATSHEIWVRKDKGDDCEGSEGNLTGIIILAILLVIFLIVVVYLVYRLKTSSATTKLKCKAKSGNNSRDVYDLPEKSKSNKDDVHNYEEVGNMAEQANYSSLNKSAREDDNNLYCHLNN